VEHNAGQVPSRRPLELWLDYGGGLRRQGIGYQQAAEQLATLPHTEQAVKDLAIEPLEAVAVPTPSGLTHQQVLDRLLGAAP
jgi:hypothetical protein